MPARIVSRVHRIPSAPRHGVLVVDTDADRLGSITAALARADRTVITAGDTKEALGALASGFVPDVVVAAIEHARDVFATMSAMPKFSLTRFVALTPNAFTAGRAEACDRLARMVGALLVAPDTEEDGW